MFWAEKRQKLEAMGVLGMNSRNLDYIGACNKREFYPLVDDKLQTKAYALEHGIPSPTLYAVIEYQKQVASLDKILAPHREFVIKPAHGSGGGGIIVIADTLHEDGAPPSYEKSSGTHISLKDMKYHIGNILGGLYSLGGVTDKAIIEYRVHPDPFFERITYRGVPDIRMVVYHGVPVMAMLRLPTRESDGKANLHSGGIGVGVRISDGMTSFATHRNRLVNRHPDTKSPLAGLQIPHWDQILEMSARFDQITGLGYIGVDIVVDNRLGPMLLEVNARPGLAIQIANQTGLKRRLLMVNAHIHGLSGAQQKVAFAQQNF